MDDPRDEDTPERISRRFDIDGLREGLELCRLLRHVHPHGDNLDVAFVVARSFSWGAKETAALLSFLAVDGRDTA